MNNQPISLLIVDDDPVFALFLQQLVASLGNDFPCVAQWVDTAEMAMAELERNAWQLVLLDYHLPGADGLQVLARIGSLPPERQPAVIMLTGSGNEAVAVEAMKRGAKDYLCKAGLDQAPLTRALHSALAQKRLADQVAAYNEQRRADLEMARHLQQSLLPDQFPTFPAAALQAASALRFCQRFIPATELAGDFFSVFALSDTEAGIFICDVMGHGVRSALVTAMMHAVVESEAQRAQEPGRFLAAINRRLVRLVRPAEGPMFATACYVIADVARGRLRYANAGHPRPLHLQRRAGLVAPLAAARQPGLALGMVADAAYATCETPLAAGDGVLLFTDGLFEVADPAGGEDFGRQRLLAAATESLRLPCEALCDALIQQVRGFAGGAEFSDDVCLLCVDFQPGTH
jgi:sigma-B regulation protein RsbU (phosphoserine phosphatase)